MASIIQSERFLIITSFLAVYIFWGATYITNYWALDTFPPFLMAGSRFSIAGLLMLSYFAATPNFRWPQRSKIRNAVLMGILFLAVGTGAMVWALQFLDTGIAALLVSLQPLVLVLLMMILIAHKPVLITWLGICLGIAGISILVAQDSITTQTGWIKGIVAICIAIFSWAIASIYVSRISMPKVKGMSAALQMIGGGGFLILVSLLAGEDWSRVLDSFQWKAFLSWLFLIFFGSIVTYSAFNYLLIKVSPDKVSTNTYVNPLVALFLGAVFNNEIITRQSLLAAFILLTGVVFITIGRSKFKVKPKHYLQNKIRKRQRKAS